MKEFEPALTLDRPAIYRITVPGELDESWSDWDGRMAVAVEGGGGRPPVTNLTGTVTDQAALHGLLRRLYALGLPLISVVCLDCGAGSDPERC